MIILKEGCSVKNKTLDLGIFSLILYARFIKQKIPYRAKRVEATKRLIKDASRQVEESCSIEQKASDWNPKAARPAKVCVLATDWRSTESLLQYEQLWKWMSRVGAFLKIKKYELLL